MSPVVGILGGGQLGRMLALAGAALGMRFRVFDPSGEACAAPVADHAQAAFDDRGALAEFAADLALATYEWENVPVEAARIVADKVADFFPPLAALEMAQDRLIQKNFLAGLGISTAPFAPVGSRAELDAAIAKLGLPAVLKTRREGYDGKGQFVIRQAADAGGAWQKLGPAAAASGLVLEGFVAFEREVSLIAVRGRDTSVAFYPLGENEHREGILRVTRVPVQAPVETIAALQGQAETAARAIMDALDYVGVLAIEFFHVDGRLLVNELATRVHNSGHWTQDGAATSQFENHLRAGAGLPLGAASLLRPTAMVNFIGSTPEISDLLKIAGARIHLYGKQPRAGRKLGHVNIPLEQLALATALTNS